MKILLGAVIAIGAMAALGVLIWRLFSRRQEIPCPAWLYWMVELDNPFAKANTARAIVETLQLKPGMAVLDAGCGPGRLTLPLARAVGPQGKVCALDLQPEMLERTRKKTNEAGLENVEFRQAGLGQIDLGGNNLDRAILVTVLGEIPQREEALQAIFRALKPGGILSITETLFDPHYQRRKTVIALAEKAGFQKKAGYGNRLAYTLHFSKPSQ